MGRIEKHHFPVQLAKEAILIDNFEFALEILEAPAEKGDSDAQFLYGYLYGIGDSLTAEAESREWIRKAAAQNHAEALYVLACCEYAVNDYHLLSHDYFNLLIGAQSERFQVAMFMLGVMGLIEVNQTDDKWVGVRRKPDELYHFRPPQDEHGWEMLKQSALMGSTTAQRDLALYYLNGIDGLEKDEVKAREWLFKAIHFEILHGKNHTVYKTLRWKRSHTISSEDSKALYTLGRMLLDGIGGVADVDLGFRMLMKASYFNKDTGTDTYALKSAKLALDICSQESYSFTHSHSIKESLRDQYQKNLTAHYSQYPDWLAYLRRYCNRPIHYDLRNTTFEQKVGFLFDHINLAHLKGWDRKVYVDLDNDEMISFYIELFSNPQFLLDRFTIEQLESSLWVIPTFRKWSLTSMLRPRYIAPHKHTVLIRAVGDLFEKLFADDRFKDSGAVFMWWDDLAYGYLHSRSARYRYFGQIIFETLTQILQLDALHCQKSALHGLNHLRHPDTKQIIMTFLEAHPELSKNDRQYALYAIEGQLM